MHENRETSRAPRPERERGRSAKVQSHKADAHALEESDRAILSMNQTNKEEQSSAEPGEKRVRAQENIVQFNTRPTQCGEVECTRDCAVYEEPHSSSLIQGGSRMRRSAHTDLCGGDQRWLSLPRHLMQFLCRAAWINVFGEAQFTPGPRGLHP